MGMVKGDMANMLTVYNIHSSNDYKNTCKTSSLKHNHEVHIIINQLLYLVIL